MYKYPDVDDKNLFSNIIDEQWEDGGLEDKLIHKSLTLIPKNERNLLLDAGCGTGRVMHTYVSFFKTIIAIDPDNNRLQKAKMNFHKLIDTQTTNQPDAEFICSTIQQYAKTLQSPLFNCVLCDQIIQHVHTKNVNSIIKSIHKMLNPGGYLILLTTNWREGEDRYSKVNTLNNEYTPLTKTAFNNSIKINDHFLPTQLFPEDYLKQLLQDNGFKILFIEKYHGHPLIKGDNFIFAIKHQ